MFKRHLIFFVISLVGCLSILLPACRGWAAETTSPLTPPKVIISGIPVTLELSAPSKGAAYSLEILQDQRTVISRSGTLPATLEGTVLPASGLFTVRV